MASKAAIDAVKAEARGRMSAMSRRYRTKGLEAALVRKASLISSAGIYGTLNRLAVPVELAGFPWKIGVAALALLGEGMSRGALQSIMAGVADATLAIYVERSISTNTLVAGDDGGSF
jgi:hypothetical protein